MIKYVALMDVAVGKRVVNTSGESVLTRLPEGSRVQGSLMNRENEIPVKMRTNTGLESHVSLPDYYPCRIDRALRKEVLKGFAKYRSNWTGGPREGSKTGETKMAKNTDKIAKLIATNEKDVVKWKAVIKKAKKAKDKKAEATAQEELDWCVNRIAQLKKMLQPKGAKPSAKAKKLKGNEDGVVIMLKYA